MEFINMNDKHTKIKVIYKLPNNSKETFLEKLDINLDAVSKEDKALYLMGDYNIHFSTNLLQYKFTSKLFNSFSLTSEFELVINLKFLENNNMIKLIF